LPNVPEAFWPEHLEGPGIASVRKAGEISRLAACSREQLLLSAGFCRLQPEELQMKNRFLLGTAVGLVFATAAFAQAPNATTSTPDTKTQTPAPSASTTPAPTTQKAPDTTSQTPPGSTATTPNPSTTAPQAQTTTGA